MVGFARLNRASVIVETLENCTPARWDRFVQSLDLDQPIEFNDGDVGLSGGIQVLEPSSAHTCAVDTVSRFGGSCSPDMQWPEDAPPALTRTRNSTAWKN